MLNVSQAIPRSFFLTPNSHTSSCNPPHPLQPLRRLALLLFLCLAVALAANAQMLFSENLTMKIDSNKPIQGLLSTMVNYKTEHEELFEFKIHSNLNILLGQKSVINLMGRFEFTTYGSKTTVNEGDLHAEYRYLLHPAFEVYPYVEAQWAGTHGLLRKVSTGLQARYRTLYTPHSTMFLTTALYYEAEDWKNLSSDTLGAPYGYNRNIRSHLSLSYRYQFDERWPPDHLADPPSQPTPLPEPRTLRRHPRPEV